MGTKGYNNLAITNDIIMVYPDTKCWDQHGQIDPENYKTNDGIVHRALRSMLERVTRESCSLYATEVSDALGNIASVRSFLADPDSNTIMPFQESRLDSVPLYCLTEVNQAMIDVIDSDDYMFYEFNQNFSAN